jgi:hypothetical protein
MTTERYSSSHQRNSDSASASTHPLLLHCSLVLAATMSPVATRMEIMEDPKLGCFNLKETNGPLVSTGSGLSPMPPCIPGCPLTLSECTAHFTAFTTKDEQNLQWAALAAHLLDRKRVGDIMEGLLCALLREKMAAIQQASPLLHMVCISKMT